ncbi:hypothetical protein ACWCXH_39925 [Kitasatospora sp. NPDC001660]
MSDAALVLFAATARECERIAAQAAPGQRIEVIEQPHRPEPPGLPPPPWKAPDVHNTEDGRTQSSIDADNIR